MVLLHGVLPKFPNDSHWVVLTSYDDQNFSYLDPCYREEDKISKNFSKYEFKEFYTEIACQLLRNETDIYNFS